MSRSGSAASSLEAKCFARNSDSGVRLDPSESNDKVIGIADIDNLFHENERRRISVYRVLCAPYGCTEQGHTGPSCTILVVRLRSKKEDKMSTESVKYAPNFESAILFMQKEHARTLKDLHEEICRLQKQCSDLTFQLTMRDVLTEEPDATGQKLQEMQKDLEKSNTIIDTLERDLAQRDERIEQLEGEAQSHKKHSLDENRKHVQTMNALYAELKSKTNQISYLTSELHQFQNKQSVKGEADSKHGGIRVDSGIPAEAKYISSDSTCSANRFQATFHYIPKPPSDDILYPTSDTSRFKRSGHRRSIIRFDNSEKSCGAIHTSSASTLIERQLRPHHLGSDSISDSKAPDISPFLQHTDDVIQVVDVKQVPVLPAIPANSSKPNTAKYITPPS